MSSDSGIYVGKFGSDYRICHRSAVENFSDFNGNHNTNFNLWEVYNSYKDSKIFKSKEDALIGASKMLSAFSFVEYGIQFIDFGMSFSDLYANLPSFIMEEGKVDPYNKEDMYKFLANYS